MKSNLWPLAVVAVVAGALGYFVGMAMRPERRIVVGSDEEKVRELQRQLDGLRDDVKTEHRRAVDAETERDEQEKLAKEATARADELEQVVARARTTEATPDDADPDDPEELPHGPRISIGSDLDENLARVDWSSVGEHMGAMIPLIGRISAAMAKGETPAADDVGAIQQHNGPLIVAGLKVGNDFPGTGVNGKFSHPAFMGNAMASTLAAMGLPLTEAQHDRLEEIAADFARRDAERLAAYADDAFALRKVIDEVELRDRYFEAALRVLTAEQHAAIRPEPVRGRLRLDLYSSALVWVPLAGMRPIDSRADAAKGASDMIVSGLGLTDADRSAVDALATTWAESLPTDLVDWEPDTLDRQGMVQGARVLASAKALLELLHRADETIAVTDDHRAKLRQFRGVRVLIPAKR